MYVLELQHRRAFRSTGILEPGIYMHDNDDYYAGLWMAAERIWKVHSRGSVTWEKHRRHHGLALSRAALDEFVFIRLKAQPIPSLESMT